MPKISQPLIISSQEQAKLNDMLSYVALDLCERIRIVLACCKEPSNKKVAESLGVSEHTVAKWKEAYRAKGIEGILHASGAGRKSKAAPDLKTQVIQLLESTDKEWSVHALATELHTTDYQIAKILKEKEISLAIRQNSWIFETNDSCHTADIETIGIYLSISNCAILTCFHQYGIETAPGRFVTRRRKFADRLSQLKNKLSLGDAIIESTYYDEVGSNANYITQIDEWMQSIEKSKYSEIQYRLFVWSKEVFIYNKSIPDNVKITVCTTQKELLKSYHSWAGALTSCAHLYDVELLNNVIQAYLEKIKPGMDAFCWSKTILSTGSLEKPIEFEIGESTDIQKPSVELWLESVISGESTSQVQTGFIAYVKDENGLTYRNITTEDMMPSDDQFGFDSEESFLKGMNQLEGTLIKLRDKAGITFTNMYLDRVKKNKIQSESVKNS